MYYIQPLFCRLGNTAVTEFFAKSALQNVSNNLNCIFRNLSPSPLLISGCFICCSDVSSRHCYFCSNIICHVVTTPQSSLGSKRLLHTPSLTNIQGTRTVIWIIAQVFRTFDIVLFRFLDPEARTSHNERLCKILVCILEKFHFVPST